MSCRVLNRRLEEQVLNIVCEAARAQGIRELVGEYRPTAKNGMVKDHYRKLGFTQAEERADSVIWTLDLDGYEPRVVPITVIGGEPGASTADPTRSAPAVAAEELAAS